MTQYSKYQKKVISNYYDNLDTIKLNKLQEIVTELYLADSAKKADKLWKQAEAAMIALKIRPALIEHIIKKRDVVILAKNVNEFAGKK